MRDWNFLILKYLVNISIIAIIFNMLDWLESWVMMDVLKLPYMVESNRMYPVIGWTGLLIVKVLYCALIATTALMFYMEYSEEYPKLLLFPSIVITLSAGVSFVAVIHNAQIAARVQGIYEGINRCLIYLSG